MLIARPSGIVLRGWSAQSLYNGGMATKGYTRWLYLAAGWLLVGLAAAGLVLPLLPTTPLLLLAASCFLRSSERSRRWLLNSRLFGPILRDWHEHRAVRRPVKLVAVAVLIAVIAGSFVRDLPAAVRVAIVLVCAVGLMVLWCLPSRPPEGAQ